MKKHKLNCKEANKISLLDILSKMGYKPTKSKNDNHWYLSPFRAEKNASFKVNDSKNQWYDHGEGIGGTVIDFIMKYNNCSITEALKTLNTNNFSFHQPSQSFKTSMEPTYSIIKVTELSNVNLIDYLKTRKMNIEFAKQLLFQVHYSFQSGKEYYGIGFMTDFGTFEIRNKFFKGCLGKKAITTINNNSDVVSIFESWSDFISYVTLKTIIPNEDFIILNSTSLVKKVYELIINHKTIKVFFDNDNGGNRAFNLLQENCKTEIIDKRIHYENYNDLNDFLVNNKNENV